jgi:hydroxyethylthiazole kinase-like uncharacterized protein yjeF
MSKPLEILSVAESRAADQAAIAAGESGQALMRRAGAGVVAAIQARWTPRPVTILCGPGSNGGDGYVVAELLKREGWPVTVAALTPPAQLAGDAAVVAEEWSGETLPLAQASFQADGLVVDALFGSGLARPLEAGLQSVLRAAERSGAPIVAIDLPSGLNGDTGRSLGHAPACTLTVTFHRQKPAHLLQPGRTLCGEVVVCDIGIGAPAGALLRENAPGMWADRMPWPDPLAHKHGRGRLVVVSGGPWNTGAARLAARGGLRIGAGVVTVLSPSEALLANAAHLEAVMLRPFDTDLELENLAAPADAAVIGPAAGVNESTVSNLFALARTGAALVIDADALTAFRQEPEELFDVLDRDDVLTPHAGEFERVFPGLLASSPERITAARRAAERAGAVILLKGPDTVVAAPDGRCLINGNGTPWLATAGSGDVLAGFVGGLIAQGMDSFDAAAAATWIHAAAAADFGPGLIAEDLPALAPAVLRRLYGDR